MCNTKQKINSFIDLSLLSYETLKMILNKAIDIKNNSSSYSNILNDKNIALLFFAPSTRTRISFEVAVNQLGGKSLILDSKTMQIERGETIKDTAMVLSRYVDLLIIRCLEHNILHEFNINSTIPIINGLTSFSHPCQIMADILTYIEKKGPIEKCQVSWIGDSNNILHSWIQAAAILKFTLKISTPEEYTPDKELMKWARNLNQNINWYKNPKSIIPDADIITTDCWNSMGNENDIVMRNKKFTNYQINSQLLSNAKSDHMFLHCLPAHRNQEVTDEIIDGPTSFVFDEAENRLHIQKALLLWCLGFI